MAFTTKLGALLGSVRFWIVTLTAALSILQGQSVVEVIQLWGIAVAGIGTLDSIATKLAGK